ncbi:helix-turn-helix domain-containing protein [Priestia aryabhattai]|uniref:helix-turn-helix domain-containing protein n=1 Tax=Priestia aryabhattai TaxID=412384 RepID=UPI0015F74315|nr:helix-turn-helix transcriptional regulator [Priestia aryabhattai]
MIRSNLKQLADNKGVSIRQISDEIEHGFETVRKMYNDNMKQYPKELLNKLCIYFNCNVGDLIKFESEDNDK